MASAQPACGQHTGGGIIQKFYLTIERAERQGTRRGGTAPGWGGSCEPLRQVPPLAKVWPKCQTLFPAQKVSDTLAARLRAGWGTWRAAELMGLARGIGVRRMGRQVLRLDVACLKTQVLEGLSVQRICTRIARGGVVKRQVADREAGRTRAITEVIGAATPARAAAGGRAARRERPHRGDGGGDQHTEADHAKAEAVHGVSDGCHQPGRTKMRIVPS